MLMNRAFVILIYALLVGGCSSTPPILKEANIRIAQTTNINKNFIYKKESVTLHGLRYYNMLSPESTRYADDLLKEKLSGLPNVYSLAISSKDKTSAYADEFTKNLSVSLNSNKYEYKGFTIKSNQTFNSYQVTRKFDSFDVEVSELKASSFIAKISLHRTLKAVELYSPEDSPPSGKMDVYLTVTPSDLGYKVVIRNIKADKLIVKGEDYEAEMIMRPSVFYEFLNSQKYHINLGFLQPENPYNVVIKGINEVVITKYREEEKVNSIKRKEEQEKQKKIALANKELQFSNENNIGRKICKNGELRYIGESVIGRNQKYFIKGQHQAFFEKKRGKRIQFRNFGFSTFGKKIGIVIGTEPTMDQLTTEAGVVLWGDIANWDFCT